MATPAIETHSIHFVPLEERRGRTWHLGTLWFMVNAQVGSLAVGLIGPAVGGTFLTSFMGIVAGVLFGTFFMAFHSAQGPHLGLPQMIQSRAQFGYLGVLLPMVLVVLMLLGFNVFGLQLIGEITATTNTLPHDVGIGVGAALSVMLACVGYRWIHGVERWLAYLFLAFFGVLTIGTAAQIHLSAAQFDLGGFRWVPFLAMFGITAGWQLAWAPYVSDYSRYLAPSVGHAAPFWWTYIGSAAGALWLMGFGSYLGAAFPDEASLGSLLRAGDVIFSGYGKSVLLYSLVCLVAVNAVGFYTASLTVLSMADSVRPVGTGRTARLVTAVVCGAAVMLLAVFAPGDFLTNFHSFLLLLLYFMIPWTAINLLDYYVLRRGQYDVSALFDRDGQYGRWSASGLASYVLGFVAMIPFFSVPGLYVGAVAKLIEGADFSIFVGLLVAGGCYALATRKRDPSLGTAPRITEAA
ncbi:cytosine permease [Nonomuraea sp. NPDC026600]|uniref:purine-cytosine permease family protein n=1 Tax=Nonomuraea sp. NPDC026600 TaxID=3155363 RepID=UPI0033D63923